MDTKISLIIKQLDPENYDGLEGVARAVEQNARGETRELVKILHGGNEIESEKAAMILLNIGDLALTPLFESLAPDHPDNYVWDMQNIVTVQLGNRIRIAKELNSMLLDGRLLKVPERSPRIEEKPIPRRVCDEAYLMLRRLLSLEEDKEAQFLNEDIFINMTDEEKDAEIERAKTTKRWASLTELFFEK